MINSIDIEYETHDMLRLLEMERYDFGFLSQLPFPLLEFINPYD